MRSVRLFFVTVCAVYAYYLLPYAQGTLIICYRMRRVRLLFVAACAAYAYKAKNIWQFCPTLRIRLQFATVCAVYAYNLLPHAQDTLTICYRMRSVR
jgi:hypothetical protein